jgi:hypothetical protein
MYLEMGNLLLEAEIVALVRVSVQSILGRVEVSFQLGALFV